MDITERIKSLLAQRKATQVELADHLGCSPSYLSNLLNKKKRMNLEMLEKTSAFFGMELEDFFRTTVTNPSYIQDFVAVCRNLTEKEIAVLRSMAVMMPSYQQREKETMRD